MPSDRLPECRDHYDRSEEGLIYHVIDRGNNRQDMFHNDADFEAFLKALADLRQRKPFQVYGYCLRYIDSNPLRAKSGIEVLRDLCQRPPL